MFDFENTFDELSFIYQELVKEGYFTEEEVEEMDEFFGVEREL